MPDNREVIDLVAGAAKDWPGVEVTLAAKPRETPEDASLRRHKDIVLFWGGLVFFGTTAAVAVFVACRSSDPEAAKWARELLTAYGAAIVGFLVGKSK